VINNLKSRIEFRQKTPVFDGLVNLAAKHHFE